MQMHLFGNSHQFLKHCSSHLSRSRRMPYSFVTIITFIISYASFCSVHQTPPSLVPFVSRVFRMAKRISDGAMSSLPEPLPSGGNVDANVISDNPLSTSSLNNENYLIVGSIPVPLDKHIKKNSFHLSTRRKSSSAKFLELISSSNHLASPRTSVFSEPSKVKRRIRVDLGLAQVNWNNHSEPSFCSSFDGSHRQFSSQRKIKYASGGHKVGSAASVPELKRYDICFRRKRNSTLIDGTQLGKNKESWIEMQEEGTKEGILRPGMVLLKHFLKHNEQVEMVKNCRDLGRGPGGFYQPGYAGGAKLRLMMMCMGMDWDPQTRKYGYTRVIDGSKPPSIPNCFSELVFRAIQEAHYLINEEYRTRHLINEECKTSCVEEILPSMTPDICIVNFYTTSGRLGLHQDRDESTESLQKRLPVVSLSIGDSAEFLYGDHRDVGKAENVLLESGDVLIFGGESRHVFHGVSSIIPDSAPQELLQDTSLRPGRLNLTFRQY